MNDFSVILVFLGVIVLVVFIISKLPRSPKEEAGSKQAPISTSSKSKTTDNADFTQELSMLRNEVSSLSYQVSNIRTPPDCSADEMTRQLKARISDLDSSLSSSLDELSVRIAGFEEAFSQYANTLRTYPSEKWTRSLLGAIQSIINDQNETIEMILNSVLRKETNNLITEKLLVRIIENVSNQAQLYSKERMVAAENSVQNEIRVILNDIR